MKLLVRMVLCLMISFSLVELPILKAQAHAGMISTTEAVAEMSRGQNEQSVNEFLSRNDVRNELTRLGVNPDEASRRLAALSDTEVKQLSQDIKQATIGGDVGGILVVVLLVLLIIYFAKRI